MRVNIIKLKKKHKTNSKVFIIYVGFKSQHSSKRLITENLGIINIKHPKLLNINMSKLGLWLNKGAILNKNVKKYLIKLIYVKRSILF